MNIHASVQVATVLSLMAGGGAAFADAIASDDFETGYTNGAIVTQGGGAGWSSNWASNSSLSGTTANNVSVEEPGVPYTDGKRAGVPVAAGNGATAYRGLATPLSDTAGSTYYLSFDGQKTNDGARYFGIALFAGATSGSERMLIGQGSGLSTWTASGIVDGANNTAESTVSSTEAANLLVKIVFGGAGAVETVSFWVNPDYAQAEGSAANLAQLVGGTSYETTSDFGDIGRIRLGGGTTSAGGGEFSAHWIDNLAITSDSPFIPEPASLALMALSLPLVLRRRG